MRQKRPQVDNFHFAAAKPTVDELLADAKAFDRVSSDFLKLDVETALTFTGIALRTNDAVKKRRNCRSARRAYDTVLRLVVKVTLSDNDAQILTHNLARLKSELQSLGEAF